MAAVAALILYAIWLTVASGPRTLVHLRRTADGGIRSATAHGSAQRWAKLLFVGALAAGPRPRSPSWPGLALLHCSTILP